MMRFVKSAERIASSICENVNVNISLYDMVVRVIYINTLLDPDETPDEYMSELEYKKIRKEMDHLKEIIRIKNKDLSEELSSRFY